MFHTYYYGSPNFHDWLRAANQLYQAQYLEKGGCKRDFPPLKKSDVTARTHDQFLLFCDDEAGICGSAAIVALPYDIEIEGQIVPQDTWMLRNVFFHIRAGHPLQYQTNKFIRIVEQFHLGLFEHLWQLAQRSHHKVALSLQQDWEAHDDLEYFGGFTFELEMIEEDQNQDFCTVMGMMSLTTQTYETYQQKVFSAQNINQDLCTTSILSKTQSLKLKRLS